MSRWWHFTFLSSSKRPNCTSSSRGMFPCLLVFDILQEGAGSSQSEQEQSSGNAS